MGRSETTFRPKLRSCDKQLAADPDCPFPVGVEYYRAPVPPQEFWDSDFARIREAGMRLVRSFTSWNWFEPQPGKFEFDDLDHIFELAAKHDLKMWIDITVATHMACPEWMLRKHPDMRIVWFDGRVQQDTAIPAAPQGAMTHNYDHPEWRQYAERFIRALVGRFKDHPNLQIWGTFDGVNLASGLLGPAYLPPYNDYTIAKYISWLEERYTLEQLNARLLRRYRTWQDVQPPRSNSAPVEMTLYRQFHYENVADLLGWMGDLIDQVDGKHEQRAHGAHWPRPWDELSSERIDGWGLAFPTNGILRDTAGMADTYYGFDWARAIGRDGRWWCEEIYSGPYGFGFLSAKENRTLPEELTTALWLSLVAGAAGALFWEYRPGYMSFDGPGLNLASLDGGSTVRLKAVTEAISQIDSIKDHLPLQVPWADVAIGYSGASHDMWTFAYAEEQFLEELRALYRVLWHSSIGADVVTPNMDWSRYKLVCLPNFAVLDDAAISKIREVMGQCPETSFIATGHFGSMSSKGHWSFHPPEGLVDLVSARLADFDTVTADDVRAGSKVLKSAYGEFAITAPSEYAILEPLGDSRAVAWLDGEVVAVETPDRRLTWWGMTPSRGLARSSLIKLFGSYGVESLFTFAGDPVVAFRRLSRQGGSLIFVFNLSEKTAHTQIKLGWRVEHLIDALSETAVDRAENGYVLDMAARSVKVLYSRDA